MQKHWFLLLTLLLSPAGLVLMGISSCSDPEPTPPPGSCASDADCTNGQFCVNPSESMGCGMCYQPYYSCTSDTECGTGNVCIPDTNPCLCNGPSNTCAPACTATSCPEGQICGSSGRCEYVSCSSGAYTCPAYTTCTAGAAENGCVRWSCSSNSECGDGVCVESQCFSAYGFCTYPPP